MAAAKTAIADADIDVEAINSKKFGVLIGSGVGGLDAVEESCRRELGLGFGLGLDAMEESCS